MRLRLLPFVFLLILTACNDRTQSPLAARSRRVFGTLPVAIQNDSAALVRPGIPTLPHAVERMAWHQLGMRIDPRERDTIVAFLGTLFHRP